eukprot:TRINITY_DN4851_c0_g1_i2.p1 TRINITY_DN4851_c0_g1~~TRINITY_DN4851_c0_g1_i2.p1  ORF type:complete len:104 (-),score=24.00 TRINITY_DN4851_c0_g1_i2:368-637(-)
MNQFEEQNSMSLPPPSKVVTMTSKLRSSFLARPEWKRRCGRPIERHFECQKTAMLAAGAGMINPNNFIEYCSPYEGEAMSCIGLVECPE